MNSGRIAQHRNYGELMARHEKELRLKRVFRVFLYFLVIVFIVMVFFLVRQVQRKQQQPAPAEKTEQITGLNSRTMQAGSKGNQ
jgi:hypothetical protein